MQNYTAATLHYNAEPKELQSVSYQDFIDYMKDRKDYPTAVIVCHNLLAKFQMESCSDELKTEFDEMVQEYRRATRAEEQGECNRQELHSRINDFLKEHVDMEAVVDLKQPNRSIKDRLIEFNKSFNEAMVEYEDVFKLQNPFRF